MKKYYLSLICIAVVVGCIGTAVGLSVMSSKTKKPDAENNSRSIGVQTGTPAPETATPPPATEQAPKPVLVNPSTRIIFESYYEAGKQTKVNEEDPPYFLLGLPKDKIQEYYPDWDIVQFDETAVKLHRTIPAASADQYVLGVKDSYVAVYKKSDNGTISLKEITNTPLGALSPDEQTKLTSGISVSNDIQLAKMLEDYDS